MTNEAGTYSNYDIPRAMIWVVVMVAIVVGGFSRGFGKADNFWLGWELVAVLATAVYTLMIFFVDMHFFRPRIGDLIPNPNVGICVVFGIFCGTGLLVGAFLLAKSGTDIWKHVGCLLAAALAIGIANCSVAWADFTPRFSKAVEGNNEKREAERKQLETEYEQLIIDAKRTLMYCDGPSVMALLIFFLFVLIAPHLGSKENPVISDEENLRPFIGGAVAFQLILSNSVFGLHFAIRWWRHRRDSTE